MWQVWRNQTHWRTHDATFPFPVASRRRAARQLGRERGLRTVDPVLDRRGTAGSAGQATGDGGGIRGENWYRR